MIPTRPVYLLAAVLALPALLAQAAPPANDTYHIASKPFAKHYCNVFGTICHEIDDLGEGISAEVKECKALGGGDFRLSCIYHTGIYGNITIDATNHTFDESQSILSYGPGPLKNYNTQLDDASSYCTAAMAFCNGFCKGLGGHKLCQPASVNYTLTVAYFECKCARMDYTRFIDYEVTDLQLSG